MAGRTGAARAAGATTVVATLLALAGCGGGSFTSSASPSPSTSSASPSSDEASPTTTTSSSSATSSSSTSSSSTTTTATATDSSAPSTSSGPLDTGDVGRKLTLGDFFNPSSVWEEQRYDIAGQQDVQGIASDVSAGCSQYDDPASNELELRLGNNFDTLEFSVAQADDSANSDQDLSVQVLANNEQVEIRSVPFNQLQAFSIPVAGVNALKIHLVLDDRNPECGGTVTAVVTDAQVR